MEDEPSPEENPPEKVSSAGAHVPDVGLDGAGRDHPCWCAGCLPGTLSDLLDERAGMLQSAFLSHAYIPGMERRLGEELRGEIPADARAGALKILVTDHLSPHVHSVDCLLDETDEHSQQAVDKMARILLKEIYAQWRAPDALDILLINEICDRQRLMGTAQPVDGAIR